MPPIPAQPHPTPDETAAAAAAPVTDVRRFGVDGANDYRFGIDGHFGVDPLSPSPSAAGEVE